MSFTFKTEEYYQKFIELQEKLRKSEEERLNLEMKFNEILQISREEEQAYYRKLRSKYKKFLEEDKKRHERNDRLLRALERVDARLEMLTAKTDRVSLLRRQYHNYMERVTHGQLKPSTEKPRKITESVNAEVKERTYNIPDPKNLHEHPLIKKALDRDKEDKRGILEHYLQSMASEKCSELFKNDGKLNFESNDNSNNANFVADDIMNSIYNRYYNKHKDYSKLRNGNDYETKNAPDSSNIENNDNRSVSARPTHVDIENSKIDMKKHEDFEDYLTENNRALNTKELEHNPQNIDYNIPQIVNQNKVPNDIQHSQIRLQSNDLRKPQHIIERSISENPNKKLQSSNNQEEYADLNVMTKKHLENTDERNNVQIIQKSPQGSTSKDDVVNEEINEIDKQKNNDQYNEQPNLSQQYVEPNQHYPEQYDENGQPVDYNLQQYDAYESYNVNGQPLQQYDENAQPLQCNANGEPLQFDPYDNQLQDVNGYPHQQQDSNEQQHLGIPVEKQHSDNVPPNQDELNYDQITTKNNKLANEPSKKVEESQDATANIMPDITEHVQETVQPHDKQLILSEKDVSKEECNTNAEPLPQHDENSQPNNQFDANGTSNLQYDENEQPIQQFEDSPSQPMQQYDENGQPGQQYDDSGQLLQQYDPNGQAAQQYDDSGQLLQQYDENGQPIQQYDQSGELLQQYDENGQIIQQYDQSGQLLQQYDENGQPIQQYDDNGQPIQQYDENGQPIQQYDPNAQYMQQYDENGQPIQQYDESGQILQQYDENGQPIQYDPNVQYDQYGNVIQYDEYGQPITYDPNQVQYDENGQPVAYDAASDEKYIANPDQEVAPEVTEKQETEKDVKPDDKPNKVMDMLDTDTESIKQDTKVSNDSDFDFSNS